MQIPTFYRSLLAPLGELTARIAIRLRPSSASSARVAGTSSGESVGEGGRITAGGHLRQPEEELLHRTRQQEAVARLARCALSQPDITTVMNEAVQRVTCALDLEFGKVLELILEEDAFLLKAAVGFPEAAVGVQRVPNHRGSQAGYTLAATGPVRVRDFREERRFAIPAILREHGILSGMSVVIGGSDRPYGVLGVHSRTPREFRPDEASFLRTVADVLGQALERTASEESLRMREQEFKMLAEHAPDIVARFDSALRYRYVNSAVERMGRLRRSDMIGKTIRELGADAAYADPFEAGLRAAIDEGRQSTMELEVPGVDGMRNVFECRVVPEPRGSGANSRTALCVIRNVTDTRRAAERIRFQAGLLDAVGEGVAAIDLEGRILYWNRHAEVLTGWKKEEVLGVKTPDILATEETRDALNALLVHVLSGEQWIDEFQLARKNGTTLPAFVTCGPIFGGEGEIVGLICAATDLTERKQLEDKLRQAQKMEAVGRLAGGVAHDFNNLLTSIGGHADLLLADLEAGSLLREHAEEILRSSNRAAQLTRQLLAFSRKQVLQPRIIVLSDIVHGMERLLHRVIGEDVDLVFSCDPAAGFVKADPTQMEQVVLNLAVNARDAMPLGGTLVVTVNSFTTEEPGGPEHEEVPPGRYVVVSISDTGSGIAPEVQPHIFEPFFTTKGPGKGTGLGLSTVYGIVQQSGGHVAVRSNPGEGTTVSVFLPELEGVDSGVEDDVAFGMLPVAISRGETLLIVEDEASVRLLMRSVLVRLGYRVLEARDGVEALDVWERHEGGIDLVLTDVIMPAMGGSELAERLRASAPGLPLVFLSGYTDDTLLLHDVPASDIALLEKPFSVEALAQIVRQTLDSAPRAR